MSLNADKDSLSAKKCWPLVTANVMKIIMFSSHSNIVRGNTFQSPPAAMAVQISHQLTLKLCSSYLRFDADTWYAICNASVLRWCADLLFLPICKRRTETWGWVCFVLVVAPSAPESGNFPWSQYRHLLWFVLRAAQLSSSSCEAVVIQ